MINSTAVTLLLALMTFVIALLSFLLFRRIKQGELLQEKIAQLQSEKSFAEGQLGRLTSLESSLLTKEEEVQILQEQISTLNAELSSNKARRDAEINSYEEKIALLNDTKAQLMKDFEVLAQSILEKKTEHFTKQQETFFQHTMSPLKEQLQEFRQRMDKAYETGTKDRLELLSQIDQLKNLNIQMSEDAVNLTNALKGSQKAQGNWGELILDKVLEQSGLRKGYEYETQSSYVDEYGDRKLPDVIVHLPDEKDLVIDSKVSLTHYQRYCEAVEPDEKSQWLKLHRDSIQQHIKDLSGKNYDVIPNINTLDFVLLFIPIEAAFLIALEYDPELFQLAYDKHIILVSPTTLLATLRTVENLWRFEHRNKNAEEIAAQAGALYDQCVLVMESLDDLGKHITRLDNAFNATQKRMSSGRGNVVRRIESIKKLGAKTKKQVPDTFKHSIEEQEEE